MELSEEIERVFVAAPVDGRSPRTLRDPGRLSLPCIVVLWNVLPGRLAVHGKEVPAGVVPSVLRYFKKKGGGDIIKIQIPTSKCQGEKRRGAPLPVAVQDGFGRYAGRWGENKHPTTNPAETGLRSSIEHRTSNEKSAPTDPAGRDGYKHRECSQNVGQRLLRMLFLSYGTG